MKCVIDYAKCISWAAGDVLHYSSGLNEKLKQHVGGKCCQQVPIHKSSALFAGFVMLLDLLHF